MHGKNESHPTSTLLETPGLPPREQTGWKSERTADLALPRRASVHVLLPAYNEAQNLPALLMGLQSALETSNLGYCITVVDDGSKDETAAIAEQAAKEIPIHLIRHVPNQGLAAALRSGLTSIAKRTRPDDLIVTMDADNTHVPALMLPMIQRIQEGHDVVVASRFQPGARIVGLSWDRKLLSIVARLLFSVLLPIPGIRDYTCGYRVFRAKVLHDALERFGDQLVSEKGFSCTVDLLLKLRGQPLVFGEVPMVLRYDQKLGDSKMQIWKTSRQTLRLIGKRLFWRA